MIQSNIALTWSPFFGVPDCLSSKVTRVFKYFDFDGTILVASSITFALATSDSLVMYDYKDNISIQ